MPLDFSAVVTKMAGEEEDVDTALHAHTHAEMYRRKNRPLKPQQPQLQQKQLQLQLQELAQSSEGRDHLARIVANEQGMRKHYVTDMRTCSLGGKIRRARIVACEQDAHTLCERYENTFFG
jgi:hypothetical protein